MTTKLVGMIHSHFVIYQHQRLFLRLREAILRGFESLYNSAKTSTEVSEYILFFPIDFNNSSTQISIIHYSIHKMLNISFIFTAVPLKGSLPKGCRL